MLIKTASFNFIKQYFKFWLYVIRKRIKTHQVNHLSLRDRQSINTHGQRDKIHTSIHISATTLFRITLPWSFEILSLMCWCENCSQSLVGVVKMHLWADIANYHQIIKHAIQYFLMSNWVDVLYYLSYQYQLAYKTYTLLFFWV